MRSRQPDRVHDLEGDVSFSIRDKVADAVALQLSIALHEGLVAQYCTDVAALLSVSET